MRTRLMNYTKSLPGGKFLRGRFSHISSIMELEDIMAEFLSRQDTQANDTATEPSLAVNDE
jgi:tRNA-dihydrouridine synthase B